MIRVTVDNRERQLISLINERDLDKYAGTIDVQVQALDIGDIQIDYNEHKWVFERKTVADLLASIKDGRYREQKARILASGMKATYIIEGDDIVCSRNERNQIMLSGVYLHTIYRDNIHMVFVKNINDTCTFLLTLCTKIIDNPDNFTKNVTIDYLDAVKVKSKKIDNITPDNCYIMQLSQIPSISVVIAKNIQQVYPTMRDLISTLETAEDKIAVLCKIDKVGATKAATILQYFAF